MAEQKLSIEVARTLERLATHLDGLAEKIVEIEEVLGFAVGTRPNENCFPISKLQSLDYVRQSVEDTAMLVLTISEDHSVQNSYLSNAPQIFQKLKLGTTRSVLLSEPQSEDERYPFSRGELDLF